MIVAAIMYNIITVSHTLKPLGYNFTACWYTLMSKCIVVVDHNINCVEMRESVEATVLILSTKLYKLLSGSTMIGLI